MERECPRLAWAPLLAVSVGVLLLQISVAGRYGFHRDELYFLEAGRHLAFGYVDQPPLVPLLARVESAVFGTSPWAVRVIPMIVGAAMAPLAGAVAREFGGAKRAQLWAATAVAGAAFVVTLGHLLSTSTFDFAFWLALIAVAARLLRTGNPRLWIGYGVIMGAALWNKQLPVLLTISLMLGLVIDRRWTLLRSRWLLVGGAIAAALVSPTIVWQATHGWPQMRMAAALSDRLGFVNRVTLLPFQLLLLGPLIVPLAIFGFRWLLGPGRTFRPLAWAYAAALAFTLVMGGRPYYPLALSATLVIAGAVAVAERPHSSTVRWVPAVIAVNVVVGLPLSLPILPVAALGATPIGAINETLTEQIGWQQMTQQVAEVVAALPDDEARNAILLAGTYGEAGALDRYGPSLRLPKVYSGHSSYWGWRRPRDNGATVIAIRMSPSLLQRSFRTCEPAAMVDNTFGIDNEMQGAPIVICRQLKGTWPQLWATFRHIN